MLFFFTHSGILSLSERAYSTTNRTYTDIIFESRTHSRVATRARFSDSNDVNGATTTPMHESTCVSLVAGAWWNDAAFLLPRAHRVAYIIGNIYAAVAKDIAYGALRCCVCVFFYYYYYHCYYHRRLRCVFVCVYVCFSVLNERVQHFCAWIMLFS